MTLDLAKASENWNNDIFLDHFVYKCLFYFIIE